MPHNEYEQGMWAEKVFSAILRREARVGRTNTQIAKSVRDRKNFLSSRKQLSKRLKARFKSKHKRPRKGQA